jgi:hypothetical protein
MMAIVHIDDAVAAMVAIGADRFQQARVAVQVGVRKGVASNDNPYARLWRGIDDWWSFWDRAVSAWRASASGGHLRELISTTRARTTRVRDRRLIVPPEPVPPSLLPANVFAATFGDAHYSTQ